MKATRHSLPITPHIQLNIPLLLSLLVAIINLALFRNQQAQSAGWQLNIPSVALVLAFLFLLGMLSYQSVSSWHDRQAMIRLCTTTLLGSLLLGLCALLLTNITQSRMLSMFGIVLIVLPLVGLLLISLLHAEEPTGEKHLEALTQAQQQIGELQRGLAQAQLEAQSRVTIPPGALPPTLPAPGAPGNANPPAIRVMPDLSLVPLKPAQVFPEDPLTYVPNPRRARFFTISKTNDPRPIINQDICVIAPNENVFALCDGASGSELPRSWGFYLGQQWLMNGKRLYNGQENIDAETLALWLDPPQQNWYYWVANTWQPGTNERNRRENRPMVAPELLNRILQRGAAATFLGLRIENNRWYAAAIGDSCLFQLSVDEQFKSVMPLTQSTSFGQTPPLLSSRPGSDLNALLPFIQCYSAPYQKGETLLMATDALSQWLLSQFERIQHGHGREQDFWQQLINIPDQNAFADFIVNLRQHEQIEEDDTSLVIIRL